MTSNPEKHGNGPKIWTGTVDQGQLRRQYTRTGGSVDRENKDVHSRKVTAKQKRTVQIQRDKANTKVKVTINGDRAKSDKIEQ